MMRVMLYEAAQFCELAGGLGARKGDGRMGEHGRVAAPVSTFAGSQWNKGMSNDISQSDATRDG